MAKSSDDGVFRPTEGPRRGYAGRDRHHNVPITRADYEHSPGIFSLVSFDHSPLLKLIRHQILAIFNQLTEAPAGIV